MGVVAFTGYRLEKLPFSEDEECVQYKAFRSMLKDVVVGLITKGYTDFISGMAVGFDTWAAETVLSLKEDYSNITLEAAIPFPGQDKNWLPEDRKRKDAILSQANSVKIVCKHYNKGCFFIRNEYMVNKADVLVCCYDGQKGGTAHTVGYAKKKDKIIIQINPADTDVSIISRKDFDNEE